MLRQQLAIHRGEINKCWEGVRLVANPDTLAEYSISANPPIDTSAIVPNLIAITTDGLN